MDRSSDQEWGDELSRAAPGVLGGTGDLDRSLERWAADALVDEAARRRTRERWLRIQAEEEASFAGTLVDLAEHGRPAVLDVAGERVRGRLVGVGADFVAVRTDRRQDALVPFDAIEAVRPEPGAADVRGARSATLDVALHAVLGPIAADRPDVLVRTRHGVALRGRLRSAGTDVLRLRLDVEPPTPTWIPLTAVAVLVLVS